ncbi:uncharacterized protein LOC107312482 isoform X2 [Coturnix japonica]|uniref:uncharacterized protein LOC107312482 isoform X2 n=1 Tax=Coturnix japonica TaxID=93934 RepID=UPI00077741A6|nr:uncharacterized protein LOC107312482 isoform X2 [Coturnix japonica]
MSQEERTGMRRISQSCPDLLRDESDSLLLPLTPSFSSSIEEECRNIVALLLSGSAASPRSSSSPADSGASWSPSSGLVTSTPRGSSPRPEFSPSAAALHSASCGVQRQIALPRTGGSAGSTRLQHRRAGMLLPGRSTGTILSSARGRTFMARSSSAPLLAPVGPEPQGAGRGRGASATRLPVISGAKPKAITAAKSRLQPPSRASQLAQPSARHKAPSKGKGMETAGKAAGRKQPPQKLPPTASVCLQSGARRAASSECACPESTPRESVCDRTRELLEIDKADLTFMCVESHHLCESLPGPVSVCGDAACAAQPAGCRLSHEELEHLKKELEQMKRELAYKTAQWEAYYQAVPDFFAHLRAAGIHPEAAQEDENSTEESD